MENIMSSPHSTLTATHPNPILFLFGVKDTSFLTPTPPLPPLHHHHHQSFRSGTVNPMARVHSKWVQYFHCFASHRPPQEKLFPRARATQRTKLLLWSSWDFPARPLAATKKCSHKKLIYFHKHTCRVASSCPTIPSPRCRAVAAGPHRACERYISRRCVRVAAVAHFCCGDVILSYYLRRHRRRSPFTCQVLYQQFLFGTVLIRIVLNKLRRVVLKNKTKILFRKKWRNKNYENCIRSNFIRQTILRSSINS